jgi:hypothetical protein
MPVPWKTQSTRFRTVPWKTLRVSHIPTAPAALFINPKKCYPCLRTLVTYVSGQNTLEEGSGSPCQFIQPFCEEETTLATGFVK